jgi:hypothetical protein
MMRHVLPGSVLSIAGLAILGTAVLQGLVNVPHLREDLLDIGVRSTLIGAVMLVLYFSVVAMFAFGALVMSSAMRSFRGGRLHTASLWIIAYSYVAFGVAGYLLVLRNPHMLGYAGMGLLVALGTVLGRAYENPRIEPAA